VKVCIAEKPSVAREIANIVGASSRKDGYFEGNGYAVTWTFGHFCTLYTPDDYQASWKRWNLDTLPMLPEKFQTKLMTDKGVKKQFAVIKKLFKNAALVINCGDAGQEGELIQRWVLKEAKYTGEVQRLWISSLTSEAVKEGFQDLKPASAFDSLFFNTVGANKSSRLAECRRLHLPCWSPDIKRLSTLYPNHFGNCKQDIKALISNTKKVDSKI